MRVTVRLRAAGVQTRDRRGNESVLHFAECWACDAWVVSSSDRPMRHQRLAPHPA
jgi:hypothetical protein